MRKICVFSGNRADYGLLEPLMHRIKQDESLLLQLLVSGSHLAETFGMTYRLIEADGYVINEKVDILQDEDGAADISRAMGLGMRKFAKAIERLKPDLSVVLGDRYETFSFVSAALVSHLPVAHIHGGELSFGAWDDALRHCITKMSHLHFTCADAYRKRVIQLGEHPDRVFNVGALGVENIKTVPLLERAAFLDLTGLHRSDQYLLVTYHPATMAGEKNLQDLNNLLSALDKRQFSHFKIVFTKANADTHGMKINKMAEAYVRENSSRAVLFSSMGQANYLSAMKHAAAVVGNSSSGILEAPCFKVPVINVGTRQDGRIRAENIIDSDCETTNIVNALQKGLSSDFAGTLGHMKNPFEKPDTAARILDVLKTIDLEQIRMKRFFDLNEEAGCSDD